MKKLAIYALALVNALMLGCSPKNEPQQEDVILTLTTTVHLAGDQAANAPAHAMAEDESPIARALSDGGVKTFAAGDQIAVCYRGRIDGSTIASKKAESVPLTADDISSYGKSASFTVTFVNPTKDVSSLTFAYPASMVNEDGSPIYDNLNTQDGTLANISALDLCRKDGLSWVDGNLPSGVTMTNQFTIVKLAIKYNDNDITKTLTELNIAVDGGTTQTYSINPTGTTFPDGPIWVIMQPVPAGEGYRITFTATDGTHKYTKEVLIESGQELLAGKIYPINLNMNL